MHSQPVFLVFGATGRTGRHFVSLALDRGHTVKALVRHPEDMKIVSPNLRLHKGSISDHDAFDDLLREIGRAHV